MPSLTNAVRVAFAQAVVEAERLGSAVIEIEHLFIALCSGEKLAAVRPDDLFGIAETDLTAIQEEIARFRSALAAGGLDEVAARRGVRALWRRAHPERAVSTAHRSPECRERFQRAEALAASGPADLKRLMRVILEDPTWMIMEQFLDLETTIDRVLGELFPDPVDDSPVGVARFGRDLSRLARDGKLRPAVGRNEETKRLARVLMQAKKNNPVLVGEAGVGKTAIVEGLALRLAQPDVPDALQGLRLVEVSLGALVAGTKYRGEFEERIQELLLEAERDRSLIVFIDEIHNVLGAGSASGTLDAANLIKPALSRGTLRCIGATTIAEYRRHIERDPALERRFQPISIDEPSRDAAVEMIGSLRPFFEAHHRVKVVDGAIEKAVDLSIRYLPDLRLPDKAIDLVDQACARAMLSTFSRRDSGARPRVHDVSADSIAMVVAERCGIPYERVGADEAARLLHLEEALARRVIGQPSAVHFVADAVRAARAGLNDPRRPVGVFLFLGPSGTGKTALAKALAETLFDDERHLIRIDMSECAEPHAVAKLIGSPPGYVGHEDGGHLTDKVRANPYCVVLFDEMEKAHPAVWDLFLQIFDEGQLTDARGRRASFREAIVILTSNLGSGARQRRPIGLVREPNDAAASARDAEFELRLHEAVAAVLRPEIRNRIQKEIVFYPLGRDTVRQIIDTIVAGLNARLAGRQVGVVLSDSARDVLMDRGFSEEFGARAMERAIRELIEQPLSRLILNRRVSAGQRVRVEGAGGGVQLNIEDRLD